MKSLHYPLEVRCNQLPLKTLFQNLICGETHLFGTISRTWEQRRLPESSSKEAMRTGLHINVGLQNVSFFAKPLRHCTELMWNYLLVSITACLVLFIKPATGIGTIWGEPLDWLAARHQTQRTKVVECGTSPITPLVERTPQNGAGISTPYEVLECDFNLLFPMTYSFASPTQEGFFFLSDIM